MKFKDMKFNENFKKFIKLSFKDKILTLTEYSYIKIQNYMNFRGKYDFVVNNKKDHENLLIIVAWYQDYLYDKVFNRVNKYLEKNIDVVIITPWKKDNKLIEYCNKFWRSYLYTKDNKLSLTQNIAIKLHNNAKYIYKMDEDIFITEWFFSNLKKKYELAIKNSEFIPWAITPVININAFWYPYFLKAIGKKEEWTKKFWPIKQEINYVKKNEQTEYLRSCTLPIDETQEKYFKHIDISKEYITNSVKYSIWCFMFPRKVWEDFWWFDVAFEWALWKEETQFLSYTINNSCPIILCENSLCWHFSFWPQKKRMKEFFDKNRDLF